VNQVTGHVFLLRPQLAVEENIDFLPWCSFVPDFCFYQCVFKTLLTSSRHPLGRPMSSGQISPHEITCGLPYVERRIARAR
jgi:hypothetical protein